MPSDLLTKRDHTISCRSTAVYRQHSLFAPNSIHFICPPPQRIGTHQNKHDIVATATRHVFSQQETPCHMIPNLKIHTRFSTKNLDTYVLIPSSFHGFHLPSRTTKRGRGGGFGAKTHNKHRRMFIVHVRGAAISQRRGNPPVLRLSSGMTRETQNYQNRHRAK